MPIIDKKTDHAERFSRPDKWAGKIGYACRKPTVVRRSELRRVRRVRRVEVAQLAANDCAERGEIDGLDFDAAYEDMSCVTWDDYYEGTPEDADAERERFRVTVGDKIAPPWPMDALCFECETSVEWRVFAELGRWCYRCPECGEEITSVDDVMVGVKNAVA